MERQLFPFGNILYFSKYATESLEIFFIIRLNNKKKTIENLFVLTVWIWSCPCWVKEKQTKESQKSKNILKSVKNKKSVKTFAINDILKYRTNEFLDALRYKNECHVSPRCPELPKQMMITGLICTELQEQK